MQKSQTGLLQSLLYQVLCACPALIIDVCPSKSPRESWKRKELFKALDKVSKQTKLPAKFCFFIDGLDEYEGDDEDIIALLQDLASSPSVKICVSSRPWNLFLDAFDELEWKLVLEDLTRDDMRKYVHTSLVQNEAFFEISKHDPRCETLVPQIAKKAQGVWLWVYLVVRDLLRDLKGEEEFPLLQRRLDSFPDELERYFENIIDRIDRIHREEAARIFLVAVTAVQPFSLLSLHYLSMEAADKDYALHMEPSWMSAQEAFRVKKKWKKLLNTRCRDLLQLDNASILEEAPFLTNKVDFLHRTVRDFLQNNYLDELRRRAGDGFDAKFSLCSTIVALSKISADSYLLHFLGKDISSKIDFDLVGETLLYAKGFERTGFLGKDTLKIDFDLVDEMLLYAKDFERTEAQSLASLLDELDRVNTNRTKRAHIHWTNQRKTDFSCTFLALAIQAGLRLYVKEKVELNKALITEKRGRPLLDYACRPERTSTILSQLGQNDVFDPQMVRLLLEHGSDPNQLMDNGHTTWSLFCSHFYDTYHKHIHENATLFTFSTHKWCEGFELMIDHGASPNVEFQTEKGKMTMLHIYTIFGLICGKDQAARLAQRMEEVARHNRPQTSYFWRLLG
jgi:hypothetical protein